MKVLKLIVICLALISTLVGICNAQEVAKQPQWWGKAPGEKPNVKGTVANVSETNIAVQTKEGVKPFIIGEKTKVMVRGEKAKISDVKIGDNVVVRFRLMKDNVPMAMNITVPKPLFRGKIVSIEGNTIILRNEKAEHRVIVNENTKYRSNGYEGKLADLRVGYRAHAAGNITDNTLTADSIEFVPALAKGAVTSIEGNIITIKTIKQLTIACQASDATAVWLKPRVGPNKRGTLADIKVGMPVDIGFHPNKEGTSTLLWINVLTGM